MLARKHHGSSVSEISLRTGMTVLSVMLGMSMLMENLVVDEEDNAPSASANTSGVTANLVHD